MVSLFCVNFKFAFSGEYHILVGLLVYKFNYQVLVSRDWFCVYICVTVLLGYFVD